RRDPEALRRARPRRDRALSCRNIGEPMTLRIVGAGITHRGTVRSNNQDCIAVGFWLSQETLEAARAFEHELDLPFACIVCDGMGSTAVGIAAHETKLVVFNVGDSRAYKVGERGLMQLSTDDTPVPSWKLGSGQERSTKLLQCFGGRTTFTDIVPNVVREPCTPGNTYLLCCDGLYETLTE